MSLRHLFASALTVQTLAIRTGPTLLPALAAAQQSLTLLQSLRSFYSSVSKVTAAKTSLLPHHHVQERVHPMQMMQVRWMSKLKPRFTGGKLKPFSSFSERFKVTGTGLIIFKRPGHRHKRFSKGPHRNRQFRRTQVLTNAYTITMKKLGFVSRQY